MAANKELRGAYRTWLQARIAEADALQREAETSKDTGLAFWCQEVMREGGRQLAQKLVGVIAVDVMPVSLQRRGLQAPDLGELERLRAENKAMRLRLRTLEAEGYQQRKMAAAGEGWGRYASEHQRANDLELEVSRLRAELDSLAPWTTDNPQMWND